MKLKHVLFVALAVCGLTVQAQEVDKAAVQSQVSAAEKAKKDLEKVDTGDKAWKFSGSVGLNAAATGLFNWAAGGNNNINGVAYTRLRLLYHGNNIAWDTNLDLEYGLSWIDQEYDKLQKSNDKISLATGVPEKLVSDRLGCIQHPVCSGFELQRYGGCRSYRI